MSIYSSTHPIHLALYKHNPKPSTKYGLAVPTKRSNMLTGLQMAGVTDRHNLACV